MNKFLVCFSFICCVCCASNAQFSITGTITQRNNNKTIEAANIFLSNTTLGTISDQKGQFALKDIPFGKYDLVVSYLGYKTWIKTIDYQTKGDYQLDVILESTSFNLEEVKVVSMKEKKRKRFVNRFSKAFFGASRNANKCTLLNPEILDFEDHGNGDFSVTAKDLLQIENRGTGYYLRFYLEKFELKNGTVTYGGKPLFETMTAENEKEHKKWTKARKITYGGSPRHFYQSLLAGNMRAEGFEMYHAKLENNSLFKPIGKARADKIFKPNDKGGFLRFKEFLKIVYVKEKDNLTQSARGMGSAVSGLGRPAEKDMIEQEKGDFGKISKYQNSYLYLLKDQILLNKDGSFSHPEWVKEYGYWALEGVADLLPLDYKVDDDTNTFSILKK